jgi:pimeloyl-ACP methyl ester carboxylesterase
MSKSNLGSAGRPFALAIIGIAMVMATACEGDPSAPSGTSTPRPIPSPVAFRQEPEGVTLADPAFEPLPGARAYFGRLGGSVYQIELPDDWNGRLVLFMHGFGELEPEARVSPVDFRTYLILHGYAWGASSFSSTSMIPGRAADETAALWDFFAVKYGRPAWTYVTGESMGGAAAHIAAERYPDRFDGSLALCGQAGQDDGATTPVNHFLAGAYVAGVTQDEFDASADRGSLIRDRIRPALRDTAKRQTFEDIMLHLTGGPRAFDREGFRMEEETNWRRAEIVVTAGLSANRDATYALGPLSTVASEAFNRGVLRLPVNEVLLRSFLEGNQITGELRTPLLSLHTTGDGQVPIEQARLLQRRADAAGKSDLLVQRVFRDPGHCGFTTAEQEASFEALVRWVEHGERPEGDDVLADDLRTLRGRFELSPRPGTVEADAVPGASDRALIRGRTRLDGAPFDARWLGAYVRRDGLITACQYTLPPVEQGRYEITVLAEAEASGCGAPGAEVLLWTFAEGETLYGGEWLPWPGNGETADVDVSFSTSTPGGAMPETSGFVGEVFDAEGERFPPGARVEASVGETLCGVASLRRTGSFSGYVLFVVGPDSVPGCGRDAALTFHVDGRRALTTAGNSPGGEGNLDLVVP